MVARKWQAEIRARRVVYEPFELAGITFEEPIILYLEEAADGHIVGPAPNGGRRRSY
jgi:hypothetical protein